MDKNYIVITSNKEYTFFKYTNAIFKDQLSIQSLFNGSIIDNSEMDHSDFSKSDFEGTIWKSVSAKDCFLKSCDIKSSIIVNSIFENCNFSFSNVNNTTFKNCTFKNCIFTETIMTQNTFDTSIFIEGSFDTGTITLSKFEKCTFKSIILGNCSFYDHIMINCKFEKVSINIDSIGRIFGLSKNVLHEFEYMFLGNKYGYASDNFFRQLDSIFSSKDWRLQKSVYLLNNNEISEYDFINSIFDDLVCLIEKNVIIKHDDLIFIKNILEQLKKEKRLPLFALYRGMEHLNLKLEFLDEENYYNKQENFSEFFNACFFIFNELLMSFTQENENILNITSEQKQYILEIHYDSKNTVNFPQMINTFLKYNGYDESYYCKLLEKRQGSIIEIIAISIFVIYALQIILYGVNGVLLQVADMTTKVQLIKNKKYQKNLLQKTAEGKQIQPEIVQNTFKLLKNKEFNKILSKFASTLSSANIIDASLKDASDLNT